MPSCRIMPESDYQVVYEKMLNALDVSPDLSPQDRLQHLLEVPEEELTAAMVPVFIVPVITMALCRDGVLIPGNPLLSADISSFKVPTWCPRVMVGDAANECILWSKTYQHHDGASLSRLAGDFFPADQAEEILSLYSLTPETSQAEAFGRIEKLCTDAM